MPDSKRPYPFTIENLHPEFQRRTQPPTREPMPKDDEKSGIDLVLEKLDGLASREMIIRMQSQQVKDKEEIMASIAGLRTETRTEVASLRAVQDTVALALSQVSDRVKKLEVVRNVSGAPRSMSPMPFRLDLPKDGKMPAEEANKLVDRVKELEPLVQSLNADLHVVLSERDEAKKKADAAAVDSRVAQERQAAVQKYAMDLEKEAKKKRAKLLKIGGALLPVAISVGGWLAHVLHL